MKSLKPSVILGKKHTYIISYDKAMFFFFKQIVNHGYFLVIFELLDQLEAQERPIPSGHLGSTLRLLSLKDEYLALALVHSAKKIFETLFWFTC